jgi:hypothetical protein
MRRPLAVGFGRVAAAAGLTALAGCPGCPRPPAPTSAPTAASPTPAPRLAAAEYAAPPIGFGGTYRGLRFGATVTADLVVTVEAGVALGPAGVSMPILKFSLDGGTFAFLPDYSPELSLELGKYHGVKWTAADGFGREVFTKLPAFKGRLVYDFKAEMPKRAGLTPTGVGTLSHAGGEWTFTPAATAAPAAPAATTPPVLGGPSRLGQLGRPLGSSSRRLVQSPPHTHRLLNSDLWVPDKGYAWTDGTAGFRGGEADRTARWCPGQPSVLPAHVRAATREGFWEPDPGYKWDGGGRDARPLADVPAQGVVWDAGGPHPHRPGLVAAAGEGRWAPAAGFTWATDDPTDLAVRRAY